MKVHEQLEVRTHNRQICVAELYGLIICRLLKTN